MKGLIKIDGKYGAKVGNIQVFTKQEAVEAFKIFQNLCNKNVTMESTCVMREIEEDMIELGFTYSDLEKLDNEYWQTCQIDGKEKI